MTSPEPPQSTWSRRSVLAALAPVPLLAAGGCSDPGRAAAPEAHPSREQLPAPSTGSGSTAPRPATAASNDPAVAPEASHAPVSDAVALTFHGAGSPQLANALLTEAEHSGARLTILAVGAWLAQYPEMAERTLHGGHELGNHTEHHLDIDAMSPDDAYQEIEQCAQRLEQLTGSRGRWFRQSQAQHASPTVRTAARRAGYTTLLSYDLDSLDYLDPGTRAIEQTVLDRIRGGDVVSMHLGHQQTVTALPVILQGLARRGLRAVTASELFPTVRAAARSQPLPASPNTLKEATK
ncbi:polysaccharide deacetylase family protein [Actinospica sp. MGRD01-02]|uniref:Polysaccharide deacetylase family protein n=1 Tax=Actinospica acidithermotolerans TaxID=2828514 RepID=A0A941IN61_9ACTN|nr:polysaccharide deacetylase family protein [Actinospica acidithermotolerans]MBR7830713.1 polysaccharide deacetylase family protein [Actinospica acidithermotolerans]